LATQFRQTLDKFAPYTIEGYKPYRLLLYTAYDAWKEEWDMRQAQLAALKIELVNHLDEFRDLAASEWGGIARESWQAIRARRQADRIDQRYTELRAQYSNVADDDLHNMARAQVQAEPDDDFAIVTPQGTFDTIEGFTDHVVARGLARFPTAESVQTGLYADYRTAVLITGADVAEERLRQEEALADVRIERERATTTATEERARRAQIRLDLEQAEGEIRTQEAERQARVEAIREAEREHARQQLATMRSPLDEIFAQFRARIYQDVLEIRQSILKNGRVRGKVAQRCRTLLNTYNLLGSATGDDELEEALKALRDTLDQDPEAEKAASRYDTVAVETALRDLTDLTHEQAQQVAEWAGGRTRASFLEI